MLGPMARTVQDCATSLEVIAGSDGIDDRQPYKWAPRTVKFGEEIRKHLANPTEKPLAGMKIGVLKEGFEDPMTDPNIAAASLSAIAQMGELGAEIKEISIPLHRDSGMIWMVALPMAGTTQVCWQIRRGGNHCCSLNALRRLGRNSLKKRSMLRPWRTEYLSARLVIARAFREYFACPRTNLLRKLNDSYEAALRGVNVLVMPTTIFPPVKIMEEGGRTLGPLKLLMRTAGATYNTATFNSSGHPGLSLPVGFVPAQDDGSLWLPTGLQIVGVKFEGLTCLKVAES